MSSQKITVALNELRTSVSQQVRSIKKDVHQLDTYKTNYDALLELPLVKHLIKENKKLKKQNSKLEKKLLSVLLGNQDSKKKRLPLYIKQEPTDDVVTDDVVIIEPPVKPENIVYEIVEEEVEEEEEEVVVVVEEEEKVVEEEEKVVEEEEKVVEEEEEVVEVVVVEEDEDSGEVYEVVIKGKTYYVMNETDSVIYDVDENGDISLEVGIYKNGKPSFNKK